MGKRINSWIMKLNARKDAAGKDIRQVMGNQRGAGMVEYGLIIAVIVFMVIGAAMMMDQPLQAFFQDVVARVRGMF